MFWKLLKDFSRMLSFRLNVWPAAIFLISGALMFALIYFLAGAEFRISLPAPVARESVHRTIPEADVHA